MTCFFFKWSLIVTNFQLLFVPPQATDETYSSVLVFEANGHELASLRYFGIKTANCKAK
jgi:hypothetical protein